MIKLVVFDMAGTTVNNTFGVHDSLIAAFNAFDFKINREMANLSIAVPKPIGIQRILAELNQDAFNQQLVEQLHLKFKKEIKRFYEEDPSIKEIPGTLEVFSFLRKKGIKIALDTGFDRETADTIIKRLNWDNQQYIDSSVTSDEVKHGRPAPDMIIKNMEKLSIKKPQEVIKVGDTPTDVKQGVNANCHSVFAVNSGAFSLKDLKQENPDYIINDLHEFIPIVSRMLD